MTGARAKLNGQRGHRRSAVWVAGRQGTFVQSRNVTSGAFERRLINAGDPAILWARLFRQQIHHKVSPMRTARVARSVFPVLTCSALLGLGTPAFAQTLPTVPAAERPASAPQAPVPSGNVGSVVHGTVDGFASLASTDTLKWLGIGAAMALAAAPADRSTSGVLSGAPSLERPFDPGKTVGGAPFQLAGAFGALMVGRINDKPRVAAFGSDLLQAQIVSQALTAGIKMAARRTRPDGTRFSFPSGHSATTFASATVVQRYFGWKAGAAAYGVATYVAASRIQEKRHFLSDVAFGAAVGILSGRAVTVGVGEQRFAVNPMATAGGGGVSFTWLGRH